MKHNQHNPTFEFCREPVTFNKFTDKALLQYCLGGTLYMPGTKPITDKLLNRAMPDMKSMVMCFEDAIEEKDLPAAEENVLNHLDRLAEAINRKGLTHDDIPLTFVRVRNADQFRSFAQRLTARQAAVLTGFVFPKFYSDNAIIYLSELSSINENLQATLYAMPILEGRSIAYIETRADELLNLRRVLYAHRNLVLNVRVGGTDFSAIFGVRRDIDTSIYNMMPVRDCLSAILNVFARDGDDFVISAPVWEFFLGYDKEDINRWFMTSEKYAIIKHNEIINPAIDGLVREMVMDKVNGFVGKTVIHPSHLRFVNAMQAVTREEHDDARQIMSADGGVRKSAKANKMNEVNPHRSWAHKIIQRASAYGVVEDQHALLKLMLIGE